MIHAVGKTRKPGKESGTRSAILRTALEEFAAEGFAGARTEAIAKAAGVNIALLFYYFKNKEQLYGAVLESIFSAWSGKVSPALQGREDPKKKILAYVTAHFGFIAQSPSRQRAVQQEMMRHGRARSPHLRKVVCHYLRPVQRKLAQVVEQGIAAGAFNPMDSEHVFYSIHGLINFYFGISPVVQILTGRNPHSSDCIEHRKSEVVRFIRQALFKNNRTTMVQQKDRKI